MNKSRQHHQGRSGHEQHHQSDRSGATKCGGFVKLSGIIGHVIGAIMFVGGEHLVLVQNQLSAENIVVAEDASFLAGDNVNALQRLRPGPDHQRARLDVGGKTYAELDREDPVCAPWS